MALKLGAGRTVLRYALLLGALALGLLALPGVTPAAGMAPGTAYLRLVHASPDAPALDVLVDGQRVASALKFADTTPYTAIPAGSHTIQVVAATAGAGARAIIATSVDFQDGLAYTIVAADRLAQIGAVVLTDDLTTDAGAQAYLRVVHASPDAPPVADVAVAGGPVALRGLAFKAASPYLPLAPGVYAFEVRPAGSPQALATTAPMTLDAGRIYTVFVIGQLADNTFQALLVVDNARTGGMAAPPLSGGGAASGSHAPPPLAPFGLAAGLLGLLWCAARGTVARATTWR